MGLFARKPIAELLAEEGHPNALKRALGAGDLIMLAIGAVIGAGLFSSIGTAAAGEIRATGEVIRSGAGHVDLPALLRVRRREAPTLTRMRHSASSSRGSLVGI